VLFHLMMVVNPLTEASFGHNGVAAHSDPIRFQAIALAHGTPGRDFRVEYPPLAVVGMRAIGRDGLAPLMKHLLLLDGLADLAIALALLWAWSKRASFAYLAMTAPLLPILVSGFDLVALGIAVVGLACSRRGHQTLGGVLIAIAAFVKVWPALLVAVLLLWRHRRAVIAAVTSLVVGGAAWLAWSGARGPLDVFTYRGARGWQVESNAGALLAITRGLHSHYEAGAYRVGAPPFVAGVALAGVTAVALLWWFWRGRQAPGDPAGAVMLGAIAILLTGATLLSPQYLVWGIPFAAIAAHERRNAAAATYFVAVVLDIVYITTTSLTRPDGIGAHTEVLVRNGVLAAVIVVAFRSLYCVSQARRTSASTSTYAVPLTSTVTECNVPVKGLGAA
jgi:hypothetical protein